MLITLFFAIKLHVVMNLPLTVDSEKWGVDSEKWYLTDYRYKNCVLEKGFRISESSAVQKELHNGKET